MRHEFFRFILLRALCAVASYGLYLLLLLYMGYQPAYVISFLAGVVLAYVINAKFVFREALRKDSALMFPLVYVVQFILSFFILKLLVSVLLVPASLALAISVILTLPLTFYMSRKVIRAKKNTRTSG